jgi:acetyltransferase
MQNATTHRSKHATKRMALPPPASLTLRTGLGVRVRPIEPDDEIHLREGLAHLSPQSRYQRFLVADFHPSDANFHYLTHPDFRSHLCLVMETIPESDDEEPRGVAVARSIRADSLGPEMAEFAIVVADEFQQQGAGTELLRALATWAYRTGVRRWYSLMLADNEAVLHAAVSVADLVERKYVEAGVLECTFELRDPERRDSLH